MTYRATVQLLKKDGSVLTTYTAETVDWEGAAIVIVLWLRIEVLPYWSHGELRLVWDEPALDPRVAGSLHGVAVSYDLVPL